MKTLLATVIRSVFAGALAALSIAVPAPAPAVAQCQTGWLDTPDIPAGGFGTNGIVRAVTSWDPDGGGILPPVLVVGGTFTMVGGSTPANNIAIFDGAGWQALGSGVTGAGATVISLRDFNGSLIVGGTFTNAGGQAVNNIARWFNNSWWTMGTGLTGSGVAVRGMTVLSGHIWVAGNFSTAGGLASPNVARWNGSTWVAVPAGPTSANAIAVFGTDIFVGGNGAAGAVPLWKFSSGAWSQVGGLTGTLHGGDPFPYIRALAVHDGKLIVGGNFKDANPITGANGIASWSGSSWAKLSIGMNEPVYALASLWGFLYAGGEFTTAGAVLSHKIARWNGSNWSSPVTPASLTMTGGGTVSVQAIAGSNLEVCAGGNFSSVNGLPVANVLRFNPSTSHLLPAPNSTPVRAMMGALTLGGDFLADVGGGEIARRCLGSDGIDMGAFSDLGGFTGPNGPVHALGTYSPNPFMIGYTVFGGSFTTAGGITTNNIATWRLSTWGTLGAGFTDPVRALATYKGVLYAAGDFTFSGSTPCPRVARYVSGAWQSVGGGFEGPVYCLHVHDGWLYAGGIFFMAGGQQIRYLAKYNGTGNWVPATLGDSLGSAGTIETPSGVYAMTSYTDATGPRLVIGGRFAALSSGVQNLAVVTPPSGTFTDFGGNMQNTVRALAIYEGDLIASGDFLQTPGGFANRIARYDFDTATWSPMSSGVDAVVYSLRTAWETELHVGGAFTSAGGKYSPHWARWNSSGRPAIHQQPSGQSALGCDATFTVASADLYAPLTYQWQRNGVDLADGTLPTGAVVAGATTATLSLTNLSNADEGSFSCVVSNACGSTTSAGAALTVCGADYNCDGFVDGIDSDEFNNDFESGDARADYNDDGFVDGIDSDQFNNDFSGGC